ncbi:MAG: hypothetical protein AAGE01_03235 [Pseudomonadota bacterium]
MAIVSSRCGSLAEHYAPIRIQGTEARTFLQAQLATDVKDLTADSARLCAYLSPQGKVLALPIIAADGNGFIALVATTLRDAVLRRLRMFVLRADVAIDSADDLVVHGEFLEPAEHTGLSLPALPVSGHSPLRIRWPGNRELQLLPAGSTIPDAGFLGDWLAADIEARLPHVDEAITDRFVAQMLDLDRSGVVSLSKGCYPGQEIVARAHYLGRVKRRLGAFEATAPTTPGTPLFDGDRPVGEVLATAAGSPDILAVVATDSAGTTLQDEAGIVYCPGANGADGTK